MFKKFIGKQSDKMKNVVEQGMVERFTQAINDQDPIYVDEEAGEKSVYKGNIAPPTFPRVFEYGEVEGLKMPAKGLIHGEQVYRYNRPLLVGETIYCYTEVKDYYEKEGKVGFMGFLVLERYGETPNKEHIFTEQSVIIITEAVRKEMGQ